MPAPLVAVALPIIISYIEKALGKEAPDVVNKVVSALSGPTVEHSIQKEIATQQLEVNRAEAGHRSIFVAGWRPAIGWVGVVGLSYAYILYPLISFVLLANGYTGDLPPRLDDGLMELTLGMLGLGGLRTWEKHKGITK